MNDDLYIKLNLRDSQWKGGLEELILDHALPLGDDKSDCALLISDENESAIDSNIALFANYDQSPDEFFRTLRRKWALRQTEIFNRMACASLQELGDDADLILADLASEF